jgi:NTE family protein
VAGISIGAVNAALIAGNPREKRVQQLRAFWEWAGGSISCR